MRAMRHGHAAAVAVMASMGLGCASGGASGGGTTPARRLTSPVAAVKVPVKSPSRPIDELEAALASPDAAARAAAAWELAGAGTVSERIGNRLKGALQGDPDRAVRLAASWALGHVRQGAGTPDGAPQSTPYDHPPKAVHTTRPSYPQDAFDRGIQGVVSIDILIDEEGRVAHAEVRESIPALDAAALATLREWRFTPAMLGGKPVATMASAPLTFTIGPPR
jgi:TonB family protein